MGSPEKASLSEKVSEHYWRYRGELPDRARITLTMREQAVTEAVESDVADEGRRLKVVVESGGEEIVTARFDRGFGRRAERRRR